MRPHNVGTLGQAITKLARTVTILQEPLNFGETSNTQAYTNTHKVTSYAERNSVESLLLHNQTSWAELCTVEIFEITNYLNIYAYYY